MSGELQAVMNRHARGDITQLQGIELVHWNPSMRLPIGRNRVSLPFFPRINNFGDLLGPILVERIHNTLKLGTAGSSRRLLSIGSILHFANDGDVVWGSGVNGKASDSEHGFNHLDVRAVRGPLTSKFLEQRGVNVPRVYGDPALLLPQVFPEISEWAKRKSTTISYVPNLHDAKYWRGLDGLIHPRDNWLSCIKRIVASECVVASSLHGIVIAESVGVPALLVQPRSETLFKYIDYYQGTGRDDFPVFETVESATSASNTQQVAPLEFDQRALSESFPADLWNMDPRVSA